MVSHSPGPFQPLKRVELTRFIQIAFQRRLVRDGLVEVVVDVRAPITCDLLQRALGAPMIRVSI